MQTKPLPALSFDDAFITGVAEIDDQHRNLVNMTNDAARRFADDASLELVRSLVQELLSYAIYHFRTEEELMLRYDYRSVHADDAARHIGLHRAFAKRVVEVQEALDRQDYVDTATLVAFLADWIREHILGTDQHLAAHILDRRGTKAERKPAAG
jgi:hemerythrin-like metal-binding protein